MEILPAIDLRDGKVVRLLQGDYGRQTTYGDDPAGVARAFVAAGATWIHVVDLDAARQTADPAPAEAGREAAAASPNRRAVAAIRAAVAAGIELGGGARDDRAIKQMLDSGVARIVVGSAALRNWAWFEELLRRPGMAGKLALGLDSRDGRLAIHGWRQTTGLRAPDLARRVRGSGLGAIVYTDIARDGMLAGPDFEAAAEVVAVTDVPVIASGGVSSIEDVRRCREIGCGGAIIGRAYYEGRIDLAKAIEAAKLSRP